MVSSWGFTSNPTIALICKQHINQHKLYVIEIYKRPFHLIHFPYGLLQSNGWLIAQGTTSLYKNVCTTKVKCFRATQLTSQFFFLQSFSNTNLWAGIINGMNLRLKCRQKLLPAYWSTMLRYSSSPNWSNSV